jgi:phospholipase C
VIRSVPLHLVVAIGGLVACGGSPGTAAVDGAVGDGATGDGALIDAAPLADAGPPDAPRVSAIKHVIVIVQENHTFDNYFGRWCTATPDSNPTCTAGPSCCEAAPAKDRSGATPVTLDDAANAGHDPDHTQACEASEIHGGLMDRYATGASCSNSGNVAIAPAALVAPYQALATTYALADRYFQPEVGSSSANDMYFAVAHHVFTDNAVKPDSNGAGCIAPTTSRMTYSNVTTLADLLIDHGDGFAFYAQGYDAMLAATFCPSAPSDCPLGLPTTPCDYDPSDVPFEYYAQFIDNADHMKDLNDLATDLDGGTLPAVAFVKGVGYKNEHPGYGTKISPGVAQVQGIVDHVAQSAYGSDTLVLVTWDEGGGFWDHVRPPAAIDGQAYGTRVPLLAIGHFAKHGFVSHVVMEHSSIVKFIEWNFLGATGQLGARDTLVNNIGSLLDPTRTGIPVPST